MQHKNTATPQMQRAKTKLQTVAAFKIATIVVGICWVGLIGYLAYYALLWSKLFFAVSALIHLLVSAIAIVVYLKQLVYIRRISNSRTIIEAKMNMVKLQSSTIWITRLLFLQMPVFVTFYLSPDAFLANGISYWMIHGLVIAFFTGLGIWLYRNISYRNVEKRWFLILFNSPEWTSLIKAMHLVREIDDSPKENQFSYAS